MSTLAARGANIDALVKATSIAWEDWTARLDAAGGKELDHRGLAEHALAAIREQGGCSNPEWWAQGIAVAYEQHIGRRLPGQRKDGTFDANVSRTVAGTMDEALERVVEVFPAVLAEDGAAWTLEGEPRTSATEKWRYWRADFTDGTSVAVTINDKKVAEGAAPKAAVALGHARLPSSEAVTEAKAFWKGVLGRL
ncbi:hypothetical protein HMPREF2863_10230 [Micrococcus sp. HMSC067E09]|uniref:hypothetical protein n=1 Tax=Micrococcus sp. HMSC067E09 TaxID=1739367 RepID=UPI0008A43C80|nr:hypothetical protein [Micrococcus sp. HMSC067E09]OFR89121.1 hypothetical protein HMPREF2863_10230 [Micrococcus sp. HMSC067E09]